MNPLLNRLRPYPFERLNALKCELVAPAHLSPISLAIGEPKHPPSDFILEALRNSADAVDCYPPTRGDAALRDACAQWLERRFEFKEASIDPEAQILPLNDPRRRGSSKKCSRSESH